MRVPLGCLIVMLSFSLDAHADWLGFRGDGTAISSVKNLPTEWTKDNILWKTKLPGLGSSSPIIVGDQIFFTCYTGYGMKLTTGFKGGSVMIPGGNAGKQKDLRLWFLSVDRQTGKIQWQKEIKPNLPEAPFKGFLREHGYASSTPVSDGKNVYVFFGKSGVFAFSLDGKQLWQTMVGDGTHQYGSATSPVVVGDTLVVNASVECKALLGLNKKTGKIIWREELPACWASPVVVTLKDGKQEVVMNGPQKIFGLDAKTGTVLWHCKGIGGSGDAGTTCSTPAVSGDMVYMMAASPFIQSSIIAIRAGGRGEIDKTHVLWKERGGAGICSPVAAGDYVYWVDSFVHCVAAKDGKLITKDRLYDNRGEYASAIVADGKVFAQTRFDGVFVLKEGKDLKPLAKNQFTGDETQFNATPAISDGKIFIRSNEFLYCIGTKE